MTEALPAYTFRSALAREITVTAIDESAAREEAMFLLWGPPKDWCQNTGEGLHLLAVTDPVA